MRPCRSMMKVVGSAPTEYLLATPSSPRTTV
jgi:hypothetical protein